MFSHIITRTVLGTVLAATLLAPVAAADKWGSDRQSGLDQAIATALNSRAAATPAASLLDPAIQAAMLAHQTGNQSSVRPGNRAGAHGPGLLTQSASVGAASEGVDWNNLGFGTGAALLIALASAIGLHRIKSRSTNA